MVLAEAPSHNSVADRVFRSAQRLEEKGLYTLSFHAMSTSCQIKFQTPDRALAQRFQEDALHWVAEFETRYSRFIPDSLISRINAAAGKNWVEIDAQTEALFGLCDQMTFLTRGVFDPTTLPLLRLWNWKAKPPVIPTEAEIESAKQLTGWRKVQRRKGAIFLPQEGLCLDLGGIGKEYAVDCVLSSAVQRGIENVLVDFGQDVRAHGKPPGDGAWHIGLQDPRNPARCWTGVAVRNHAVATSGDVTRHFMHQGRRYGHIVDPRSGSPVNNGTLSVSVIAPNCTLAGILSTAAFIVGPKEGLEMMSLCPGVEGCISSENTRYQTRGFHAYTTS